jgi:hypothetical protein
MAKFDITDKCIKFVSQVIREMPGNPGQESLVDTMIDEAYGLVIVDADFERNAGGFIIGDLQVSASGEIHWKSNHPEAIEIIIDAAEDNTDLIIAQAEILGPFSFKQALETGNWKIVGLDT